MTQKKNHENFKTILGMAGLSLTFILILWASNMIFPQEKGKTATSQNPCAEYKVISAPSPGSYGKSICIKLESDINSN